MSENASPPYMIYSIFTEKERSCPIYATVIYCCIKTLPHFITSLSINNSSTLRSPSSIYAHMITEYKLIKGLTTHRLIAAWAIQFPSPGRTSSQSCTIKSTVGFTTARRVKYGDTQEAFREICSASLTRVARRNVYLQQAQGILPSLHRPISRQNISTAR